MKAKLVQMNGRIGISVNGTVLPPTAVMTYYPNARTFRAFQRAGTPFASFGAYAPDYGINDFSGLHPFGPHFWTGDGQYDFREVDRVLAQIAPRGNEAFIFPRVYLDCPNWWAERYPDELCRDDRGCANRESFASARWREDAACALRALIDHIASSAWRDCVVGYHIACGSTEEWTYHHYADEQFRLDFSAPNLHAFQTWLQRKYGTPEALSAAWGVDCSVFEQVRFPALIERCYSLNGALRDEHKEKRVVDFWAFTSWLFADTIDFFCSVVKEHSGGNLLAGAFYGYIHMLTKVEKGHFALADLLHSPHIDFIASTHGNGAPGRGWPFGTAIDSIRLHGKLFFSEADVRTCLSRPMGETLPQAVSHNAYYRGDAWKALPSMELSLSALKKACARVLTGRNGVWWFDMFGGWFDAPEMMELFRHMNGWMRAWREQPLKSDIAVVIDESGLQYLRRMPCAADFTIGAQAPELDLMGAPYDIYEARDLADPAFPIEAYRLYILLDFICPCEAVREAVRERLRGDGRTLLWGHFSNPALAQFDVRYDASLAPKQGEFAAQYFPSVPVSCPRFGNVDGLYPLVFFADETQPCVCARVTERATEIYSLLPALPTPLLMHIAVLAGAHLYTRKGDVIYAGGNFVALHARSAGEKRIQLPLPVREMRDAETGERMRLYRNVYTDFSMREYETRLFMIEP